MKEEPEVPANQFTGLTNGAQAMKEDFEVSPKQFMDAQDDMDELFSLEKALQAPRWRERAKAAELTSRTLLKYSHILNGGPRDLLDVHERILRHLFHRLALKDTQWQVRQAAVESSAAILASMQSVLATEKFVDCALVLLAVCVDVQPEVQLAASNCILEQSASLEQNGIITKLCDDFVKAATSTNAKRPSKIELTGLDNLPDGEMLLHALIGAISLYLLPKPTFDAHSRQCPDRVPLLLAVATIALEDASKRQSRVIAKELSTLLRCLGVPFYRQSLLRMFDASGPVYLSGDVLARTYQNAGLITEETRTSLNEHLNKVTLLKGLSLALEPSNADEFLTVTIRGGSGSALQPTGLSEGEVVALQQIVEMLHVPDELTRTLNDQDKESRTSEFTESGMPLLSIMQSVMKDRRLDLQNQPVAENLVEDMILCCATFAGGDGEYGEAVVWTSKPLRELSSSLLACLSDAVISPKLYSDSRQEESPSAPVVRLISMRISSLLQRIKHAIKESSGYSGIDGVRNLFPEGRPGLSISAAYQMEWILRQLGYPNLGPHCQVVMPCVLTALDHFSPQIKTQAMGSCVHLVQNVNPTELRWYKDVLLDAVARTLSGCGDLWAVAVKMAVVTVTRIEGRNSRSSWYGRIFGEMVDELERHRENAGRRIVWLREISPYMEAMGLFLVAHFKRLLPLLYHWLHATDDSTCILTLSTLQVVITYTWPRIPGHVKSLWKELKQTYQESSNRKASSDVKVAVCEVCRLLQLCAGPNFEAVWQQDVDYKSVEDLVSFLKQIKTDTKLHI